MPHPEIEGKYFLSYEHIHLSVQALAQRIALLVSDAALRKQIGAAGQKTVRERFSIPRMVERVEALFQSTAERRDWSAARD